MRRFAATLVLSVCAGACQRDEPVAGGKSLRHWKEEAQLVSWMSFWNSEKDERRREAFRRLSEIGEPAVPTLVELMREARAPVSGDAFNALANLGPRAAGAVPDLVRMLGDPSPELRIRGAWVLGTIGPAAETAVTALTPLLTDTDERIRRVAAQALGSIGGAGRVALDAAGGSPDARLRQASIRGASAQRLDPDTRRARIATALSDTNPDVRLAAGDLLMGARRDEVDGLAALLVQQLTDPDPRVRAAAHMAFNSYLQRGIATPALLAVVLEGGDHESRADAAWHLGVSSPAEAAPLDSPVLAALRRSLTAENPTIRVYAARALAQRGGSGREEGLRVLRREIGRLEPILAVRAGRVLWQHARNAAEVRAGYEAALRDPVAMHRVEAISAVSEMGAAGAIFAPLLENLRSDPDAMVRDRADKALYHLRRQ